MIEPSILARPEFAILRLLARGQLERIRPREAERGKPRSCPMAQVAGESICGGYHLAVLLNASAPTHHAVSSGYFRTLKLATQAFIDAWDLGEMPVEDLEAAVAAALAERGSA
jgi:hypothetical protein